MDTATTVRELAKAAGCERDLSDAEVRDIMRKLAAAYVDDILDKPEPEEKPNGEA